MEKDEGEKKIRVLIADDHPVVRHGLRTMLELDPRFEVIGEAGDGEELLLEVGGKEPDVVLVDLRMPGMGGIEAARRILGSGSPSRLLVLTAYEEEEYMLEAIRAGVHGYLLKEIDAGALANAVAAVSRGEMIVDERVGKAFQELASRSLHPAWRARFGLTAREVEVLELLLQDLDNREIASRLYVSPNTLKYHLKNLYGKMGVHNRDEARSRIGKPRGQP